MKEQIISKLFNCKWNYAWGKVDEYLISLFYKHGGFRGLYNHIISEQERMNKSKDGAFDQYYSDDLPEILKQAIKLNDNDFEDYIFHPTIPLTFNKNNFRKLKEYGLLKYFYDFGGNFRGNIVSLHKITKYEIIETNTKGELSFYNVGNFTTSYSTLEEALLMQIFKGRFYDALVSLFKTANEEQKNNS